MSSTAPASSVRWLRWILFASVIGVFLWGFALAHNPASLLLNRAVDALRANILKEIDSSYHPIEALFFNFVLAPKLLPVYLQVKGLGWIFATMVFLVIPAASSIVWAGVGHSILKIGGAPGGWRRTWQAYALHRVWCDGLTLATLVGVCYLPLALPIQVGLLLTLLPTIRFGTMVFLWVKLARAHQLGDLRTVFIGLPKILIVTLFSTLIALAIAGWFGLYLAIRAF
jgi:hypothetical protein